MDVVLYNGESLYSPDGVETATPFDFLVLKEEWILEEDEEESGLAIQAQVLWEFLIAGDPWLPHIAEKAYEAADMFGIKIERSASPWGAGDPKNAMLELKRLKMQRKYYVRRGRGILEESNEVARKILELAANGAESGAKYVQRLVMFAHLLTRGDLFLGADGAELGGLFGRGRRGLSVPLRNECRKILGVGGIPGLSDADRQKIAERRRGNDSRMGGRWARVENSWTLNS